MTANSDKIEVLKATEAFKKNPDGGMKFSYVKSIVRQNGSLFHGKSRNRYQAPTALDQLEEVQKMHITHRGHRASLSMTYIKEPGILPYADGSNWKKDCFVKLPSVKFSKKNKPQLNIEVLHKKQQIRTV